ncbi:hypothetical protein BDFB_009805 [Asbolus verrucosus]|uniref:Syndecan n=1 Tax=Asbolus verrucosus TaxID=1661398 RepID=A0A482WDJ5_ASBVE|nr:hypothetical protein BDFB_009805 [Asbolus verrucosus]
MRVLWLGFVICSSLAAHPAVSLPATTTESTRAAASINSVVPLEFPKYSQNYTFVDNSSIRENLASHSENDTEVDDLLGKDAKENPEAPTTVTVLNLKPNPSEEDEDINGKIDTEWIENGDDTEDDKFVPETSPEVTNETVDGIPPMFDGFIFAILAGTFLVISIFAYAGLMLWRRFLEMKYGSREMLVNEDDFIDPDDMKHFSHNNQHSKFK